MKLPVLYADLSPQERRDVREEYVRRQSGLCHHCGCPLTEAPAAHIVAARITPRMYPTNFFKFPVHLHHSHKTGLTIGAVHNRCNAVLWEHHGE